MKEIIDGNLYDTDDEQTRHVATYCPVADRGDFNFLKERLYQTSSGQYFISGEGGPKTKYRKRVGTGEYSGSSSIEPLSEDDAFRWMQEHGIKTDIVLDEFGDRVSDA